MRKYAKPQMMAKNAPTGSYAAGCPTNRKYDGTSSKYCSACEVAK